MTNQSDIKKLAEQMASSMKSFEDIKDFQKQLMQSLGSAQNSDHNRAVRNFVEL